MYKLGIDIGVSSVGWGIIDDKYNIVDCGVRLFSERSKDSNVDRRGFRSSRRRIRRVKHRLERMKNLLENVLNIKIKQNTFSSNPYAVREKGISEKLSKEELVQAILHLTKRRGTHFLTAEDFENQNGEKTVEKILSEQEANSQDKYVCQMQNEKHMSICTLKQYMGKVRGAENRFRNKKYLEELQQLLKIQANFYPEIEQSKEAIENIYSSKREYWEGPGSEKSPSKYGQYRYGNDGRVIKVNLIDIMRGKCTYYPQEARIAKQSYSACLFNLLNDLNNILINNEKITFEQKQELVEKYIDEGKNINLQAIASVSGVKKELVSGYRIDKDNKAIFTEFKGYKNILKALKVNNLDNQFIKGNRRLVDEIVEIMTKEKDVEKIAADLQQLNGMSADSAGVISQISGISEYHALSLKAINTIIEDLWHTPKNQMVLFAESGLSGKKDRQLKSATIEIDIENWIVSPVVKRSVNETVKIINALRAKMQKEYGAEFEEIVIEMAREKNSEEKKNFINKIQKENEKNRQKIAELMEGKKISGEDFNKIRMLIEQGYKCAYSLRSMSPNDVLLGKAEVDHIIPLSLSFDDSQANKVLVYVSENQEKRQRTPRQYLKSGAGKVSFEEFKDWVCKTFEKNKQKRENLLYEGDPKKDIQGFINRNLVDTRYACKEVLNLLQRYFKQNEISTKVSVIKGGFTAYFRKKAKLSKERDKTFAHHAQDALIVAGLSNSSLLKKLNSIIRDYDLLIQSSDVMDDGKMINKDTGEVLGVIQESDFNSMDYIMFIKRVERVQPKFSHKVDRKPNRELYDQNIKATREQDGDKYIVTKCKNIYTSKDGEKLKELIETTPEKLLMYKHDYQSFEKMQQVVEFYKEAKNPFAEYYKEHNAKIRKYAKEGKYSPEIDNVKYLDKKLGNHRAINNPNSKNLAVLLSIKTLRADIYWDNNKYTFVSVPYDFIITKNNHKGGEVSYDIDLDKYNMAKVNKGISAKAKFLFSLHKGEFVSYIDKNNNYLEWYYSSVNNDSRNKIEVKEIGKPTAKQEMKTIGKDITELTKYHVDILGNRYPIKEEKLKLNNI